MGLVRSLASAARAATDTGAADDPAGGATITPQEASPAWLHEHDPGAVDQRSTASTVARSITARARRPSDGQDLKQAIEQGGRARIVLDGQHYRVPNPVHLSSNLLTITGSKGSRVSRDDPDKPLFHFARPGRKTMGVDIENLDFFERSEGNAPLMHNLGVDGREGSLVEDLTIRDCRFKDVKFNGILMFERCIRLNFENNKIERCSARVGDENERGVIHLFFGSADPHINRCTFDQGDGAGRVEGTTFLFEGGGHATTNGGHRLENTVIMKTTRPLWWDGLFQTAVRNVVFDGYHRPPLFRGVGTLRVSDISAAPDLNHGMVIIGGDNHNITNSRFQYADGNGLQLLNVTDSTVSNSTFRHFSQGLRLGGVENVTVSNVVCADNGGHGLVINRTGRGSRYVEVNGGIYHDNTHGIGVYGSEDVGVLNARAHSNRTHGINIDGSNTSVRVKNCTVTGNAGQGIAWGDPGGTSERRLNTSQPAAGGTVDLSQAAPVFVGSCSVETAVVGPGGVLAIQAVVDNTTTESVMADVGLLVGPPGGGMAVAGDTTGVFVAGESQAVTSVSAPWTDVADALAAAGGDPSTDGDIAVGAAVLDYVVDGFGTD